MKQFFTFIFSLVLLFGLGHNVMGQGFEVAPVIVSFDAEPGAVQTKKVTISNYHNKRMAFVISLSDFTRNDNGEKQYSQSGTIPESCADWLTITPTLIEIDPNESKEVEVMITVPSGQNGTKWVMMYVRATEEQTSFTADKAMTGGIVLSPTIGVHIYQSPKSNGNYKASVSNFKEITKPKEKQRKLSVRVENLGEKNLDCRMHLVIANMETAEERKASFIRFPVFPGGSRNAELVLPDDLAPGEYSVAAILDYGRYMPLEGIQMTLTVK